MKNDDNSVEVDASKYRKYLQSQLIDNVISGLLAPKTIDEIGHAKVCLENTTTKYEVIICNYKALEEYISPLLFKTGKVKQSVGKLLDCFLIKMAETNNWNNDTVTLKLSEYAELTGKKDIKDVRKQTNKDLQILKYVKIKSISKNKDGSYIEADLCRCSDKIENGVIKFRFSDELFKYLKNKLYLRVIPLENIQISEKSTNAYLLFRKIVVNSWTNAGDSKRENTIKIGTLYNFCTTLPRYDGIDFAVTQRIEIPFNRDLQAISSFTTDYISDKSFTFDEWLNIDIQISWVEPLPDMKQIIQEKEKHKMQREKAKEEALIRVEMKKIKKGGGRGNLV